MLRANNPVASIWRWLALVSLGLAGCAGMPPSALPQEPANLVVVKTVRIPTTEPWVSRFASHTWLDVKNGAENAWERLEILSKESGVMIYPITSAEARADARWTNRVEVIGLVSGDAAEKMIPALVERAKNYPDRANYSAWPGPNSNTFITYLARETPGLHLQFNHNAVGKDYVPWFYVGPSVTGTGWQVDTWLVGLQIGLREGIEVHLLQFTFGISIFPPALKLPFLPKLGFSSATD